MNKLGLSATTGLALKTISELRAIQESLDPDGTPAEYLVMFAAALVGAMHSTKKASIDDICGMIADTARQLVDFVEKDVANEQRSG